jgi:hypothetical protein
MRVEKSYNSFRGFVPSDVFVLTFLSLIQTVVLALQTLDRWVILMLGGGVSIIMQPSANLF